MQTFILLSSKLCSDEKGLSGSPPISSHLCFRVHAQFDNNLFGSDASLCNRCHFHPLLPFLSCNASTRVHVEHLQNSARWKLYIHTIHVYIQTTHTYTHTHTLDWGISHLDEFPALLYCMAVKALALALRWDRHTTKDCLQDPTTTTTAEINQFIYGWGMVTYPVHRGVRCLCEMTISRLLLVAHLSFLKADDNMWWQHV